MTRRLTTAAVAVTGLLALPGVANASVNFGSPLAHSPANGENCDNADQSGVTPCTFVGFRHGDPPNGIKEFPAPSDGVVTKLRIRTFPSGPVTFAFANISEQGSGNQTTAVATLGAVGPTVQPAGTEDIEEFPARVSVKQGMRVALQSAGEIRAVYNSDGGRDSYEFAPQLVAGQGPRGATDTSGGELLVQAVLEPDADQDGFGDETQDQCPDNATAQTLPCPVPPVTPPGTTPPGTSTPPGTTTPPATKAKDTVKPRMTRVALTRTGIRLTMSETAKVTIKIRRSGRTVKTIVRTRNKGPRTIAFARNALKAGRYQLQIQAQDAAKNKSAMRVVSFEKA